MSTATYHVGRSQTCLSRYLTFRPTFLAVRITNLGIYLGETSCPFTWGVTGQKCGVWCDTDVRLDFQPLTGSCLTRDWNNNMFSSAHSMRPSWTVVCYLGQQRLVVLHQPYLYSSHTTGHILQKEIWNFLKRQKPTGVQRMWFKKPIKYVVHSPLLMSYININIKFTANVYQWSRGYGNSEYSFWMEIVECRLICCARNLRYIRPDLQHNDTICDSSRATLWSCFTIDPICIFFDHMLCCG